MKTTIELNIGSFYFWWWKLFFSSGIVEEEEEEVFLNKKGSKQPLTPPRFTSKSAIRAMWRKAIMEQILLIRMEKENSNLKGLWSLVMCNIPCHYLICAKVNTSLLPLSQLSFYGFLSNLHFTEYLILFSTQ